MGLAESPTRLQKSTLNLLMVLIASLRFASTITDNNGADSLPSLLTLNPLNPHQRPIYMGGATTLLFSQPNFARIFSAAHPLHKRSLFIPSRTQLELIRLSRRKIASAASIKAESRMEETSASGVVGRKSENRVPLSEVVTDCVKRWFQDTLKEAKSGDITMQVLVGQMYNNGYGVAKDVNKGRAWINKASKVRSAVWKVSEKRPGYNASDSDSDAKIVDAE